jgi:4-amino-4-deoxy-L-arabinose transferase-like glycosyltransferase
VSGEIQPVESGIIAAAMDVLLALGLSLLTVLSRLPYRARMLYNWDAVQFALALKEFDVAKHQPHPPGYFLYVLLGRLLDSILSDPNASYVALAVLASGATTFVVYFLAKALYDRLTAVAAASLLAVSPLFWFYGEVALTYAGEALFASAVAYLTYQVLQGSERHVYLSAIYLGLAGGMRPSILLLLFPLWLGCAAVGRRSVKVIVLGLGALAAAVLTWFLPMIWLTGGFDRYLAASQELLSSVVRPTSLLGAETVDVTLAQFRSLLASTAIGLGPLLLAILGLPFYRRRHGWGRAEWFLLGWIAPPVAFYTLVHFGQAGYVLTFLPALVILLSRILVTLLEAMAQRFSRPEARWALVGSVLIVMVLANSAFFVSAKPLPRDFGAERPDSRIERLVNLAKADAHDWIWSRTAAALREHEGVLGNYVSAIRGLYDPSETVILTELGNPRSYPWLRHAMFYLHDYPIYQLRLGDAPRGFYAPQSSATMKFTPESRIVLPSRVKRLVWFVDYFHPAAPRPRGLSEIALPYGRWLYVLPIGRRPVEHAGYTFVVEREPRRTARVPR